MKLDSQTSLRLGLGSLFALLFFVTGAGMRERSLTRVLTIALLSSGSSLTIAYGIGAIKDKSGSMQLEIDRLQGENKLLRAKIDHEYQDKKQTVEACLQTQDELSQCQEKLRLAQQTITALEPFKSHTKGLQTELIAAKDQLTETVRAYEQKLSTTIAEWEKRYQQELHIDAKRKVQRVRERLYSVYERNLTNHQTEWQSELEQLRQERDRLKDYIKEFAEKDLKEVEQTFSKEWEENDKALQQVIERLQTVNADLSKPALFAGENPSHKRANIIIEYFWTQGLTLDARWVERSESADTVYYQLRNVKAYPGFLDALNDKDARNWIQIQLGLLSPVEFEFEPDRYLIKVKLHHSRVKVESKEIDRLWKSKEQFLKIASTWSRVRVTGGSESGKSPTAENIAYAILTAKPGRVKLANPQHDSQKNHWSVEPVWTSHKGSLDGLKEQAELVEKRSNGLATRDEFILYLFDEIDTTMSQHKTASKYVLDIIKQASHQNLGIILTGQNANASEYPGMDRSDFENVVNVHIGSNSKHAIVNSNMSSEMKSDLEKKADKLLAYCESKNFELGLDKTDPQAYRFALIIEPQKTPYFVELPYFGSSDLSSVQSVILLDKPSITIAPNLDASSNQIGSNPDSMGRNQDASKPVTTTYIGVTCPKCLKGILNRTKENRGINQYLCDTCNKSTSERVLEAQSRA